MKFSMGIALKACINKIYRAIRRYFVGCENLDLRTRIRAADDLAAYFIVIGAQTPEEFSHPTIALHRNSLLQGEFDQRTP